MILLGTIVNVLSIIIGGLAGLVLKRFLAERITESVMQGVGLAVLIVGLSGALSSAFTVDIDGHISAGHILMMIISLAIGALIGELMQIEDKLHGFAKFCESKFVKPGETSTFAQGFVTATLVFCIGSMAIIGSLEDGINKNRDILFAKSVLDGIVAMIFASTMGAGVLFSAVIVGLYQGSITLLAIFIAPYFNEVVVAQISLVGSVLIMSIGLNMLKIAKIKVSNLLPAIFVPVIYYIARLFV
ncbi:MAG: DUF554 domain-containing protein [Deltaproteobacteria bacterium]|nr:DUF554 domain-containing protein [Deltaproteobacteria bacterium]